MNKLRKVMAVLLALGVVLATTSAASAAPRGQQISFDMPIGDFCDETDCTSASASFDGRISEDNELSNLSGVLAIGSSPFAQTERHLNIKAPTPASEFSFEEGDPDACRRG